jgi:LPS sulfotransferase NodH
MIAALPRTASTLLARGLRATRVAGAPDEYLNPLQRRRFARWGRCSLPDFAALLLRHRTSPNGAFGLKIHHAHLERHVLAAGHDLPDLFGPLRWIAVTRVDLVAQAVSLDLARRTGRWWGEQPERVPAPAYDAASIRRRLAEIRRGEVGWERYFAARGIRPLRLTYEAITEQYEASIRRALRHLGTDDAAVAIPQPETAPTAGATAAEWIERFRAQM